MGKGEGISVEVGGDGNNGLSDANMTGGGGMGDGSDVNDGVGASVE